MSKGLYFRLAVQNLKKNRKTCLPYLLTCICTVTMFYFMSFLAHNPGMERVPEGKNLVAVLNLGTGVIAVFSFIFLIYTNSFLMKRRKKELGLYNILGMEKKHIGRVMMWETLVNAVCSLAGGILLGILGSKLIFLVLLKLLCLPVQLGFYVPVESVCMTGVLFGVIFLLSCLNNLRQVYMASPAELLKGGNVGEKEPKTRWLLVITGMVCLGTGYWLTITTTSILDALGNFFIAVLLVMAGTYCLFMAVSVAVLKVLKKWKKFYYQTSHFTAVSGMIYRMKQNAAGLANICILSTGVLLMTATTVCLYIGREEILRGRYPQEVAISAYNIDDKEWAGLLEIEKQVLEEENLQMKEPLSWRSADFAAVVKKDRMELIPEDGMGQVLADEEQMAAGVVLIPLEDYNAVTGEDRSLNPDQILLFVNRKGMDGRKKVALGGREWKIAEELPELFAESKVSEPMLNTYYLIMDSVETVKSIQRETTGKETLTYQKSYNLSGSSETFEEAEKRLGGRLNEAVSGPAYVYVDGRQLNRASFYSLYGSLFFLGIFLGLLFLMATALIIYYKQISEGYDDRQKFEIMQKVGMSKKEVARTISSQILMVFFLPLLTAVMHIGFAFPLVRRIMRMFNLYNTGLFAACTLGTAGCFALVYAMIYILTARMYYKIVNE